MTCKHRTGLEAGSGSGASSSLRVQCLLEVFDAVDQVAVEHESARSRWDVLPGGRRASSSTTAARASRRRCSACALSSLDMLLGSARRAYCSAKRPPRRAATKKQTGTVSASPLIEISGSTFRRLKPQRVPHILNDATQPTIQMRTRT